LIDNEARSIIKLNNCNFFHACNSLLFNLLFDSFSNAGVEEVWLGRANAGPGAEQLSGDEDSIDVRKGVCCRVGCCRQWVLPDNVDSRLNIYFSVSARRDFALNVSTGVRDLCDLCDLCDEDDDEL
jgi:hypothetical protein